MTTMTPTTIRMTLRALLPELGAAAAAAGGTGAAGGVPAGATGEAVVGGSVEARIGAPHLLQNLVPAVMFAPQELQNAIVHLTESCERASIPQIRRRKQRQTQDIPQGDAPSSRAAWRSRTL